MFMCVVVLETAVSAIYQLLIIRCSCNTAGSSVRDYFAVYIYTFDAVYTESRISPRTYDYSPCLYSQFDVHGQKLG